MLSYLDKASSNQILKVIKYGWFLATEDVNVLLSQFEGSRLEPHSSRWVLQKKSKIDMNEMTLRIQKYVSIMSILHVK